MELWLFSEQGLVDVHVVHSVVLLHHLPLAGDDVVAIVLADRLEVLRRTHRVVDLGISSREVVEPLLENFLLLYYWF